MFPRVVKRGAIAALICCAWICSTTAFAEEQKHSIDLPPAELVSSLDLLGRQSGIEFIYDADQLRGIHAPAVSGLLTPKEALRRLLQGTTFGLVERPSGALVILASPQDEPPQIVTGAPISGSHSVADGNAILDQIVVTGTHIRGGNPIGAALQIYTREDIEQSGSATLEEFARQMPENFAGLDSISNVNSNLGILPQGAANNIFNGAAFDLKGLGVGSTLTLLNGHRMAPAGFDGSFVDISQIPVSAIDHLEVLDDGASAIYGSDAVAGVVNIITRRDFTGIETGLRYGTSTEGGAGEYTASQLVGHSWAGGNVLVDYEYNKQSGLDASERHWIPQQPGPYSLIPRNRRDAGFMSVAQEVGNDTALTGSLFFGDRNFESHAVISGSGARQSSLGHAIESASNLSIERRLGADWMVDVTGNYSETRQASNTGTYALPAVESPAFNEFLSNSKITEVDARSSGSIARLAAGAAKISLGGSYRTESFDSSAAKGVAATSTDLRRDVASAYAELLVPVFGGTFALPGVRRLEFSAAYRYDHYRQFGSTSNPKFGWLWQPLAGLKLRGTYGTSYQAPFLSQLGSPITSSTLLIPDRNSPSGRADILEVSGGNPTLLSERSRTLTVGLDAQPANIPGLTATADAFHVVASNRIQSQNIQSPAILTQPLLVPFLSDNPSAADVQSYFGSSGFEGDNAGLGPSGVVAVFDNRVANIYSTIESGIHFSAQYALPSSFGQFTYTLSGTHLLSEQIRPAVFTPWFDVDNTIGEPTKWKLRGSVGWARNGFASRLGVNYANAYENTLFTPYQSIGSSTTADLYASYVTGPEAAAISRNLKIALSVQNVTAQRPPHVAIPADDLLPGQIIIPFDGANASPLERIISLQVTKRW